MAVTTEAVDGTEEAELDYRALTEYLTVLPDGDVRARSSETLYTVTSESGSTYLVEPELGACECPDSEYRDRTCKHIRRVKFATGRRPIPEWITDAEIDDQLGIHVDDIQPQADDGGDDDDLDRGRGVETDGGQLVGDGGEIKERPDHDLPPLHVGDHVQDREDPDATLIVTGLPLQRAATYVVDEDSGATVADYNDDYPETDPVVKGIYPQRTDTSIEGQTYAFPRSRLELVEPVHDRDEGDEPEAEVDRGDGVETDGGVAADTPDGDNQADETDAVEPSDRPLPRSFLVEGEGPVTRITERADGVTERETVAVEISQRLETLGAVDEYYRLRSKHRWKQGALNIALRNTAGDGVRYELADEQIEAWTIQVDGHAAAYRGVIDVLEELKANTGDLGRDLSGTAESLHYGRTERTKAITDLAQDCKRSGLFGPGAAIAQLAEKHAAREDITGYAEALVEDLEDAGANR